MDIEIMEDADLRTELASHGVKLHHKTGSEKLRTVLAEVIAGTYVKPIKEPKVSKVDDVPAQPSKDDVDLIMGKPTDAASKAAELGLGLSKEARALRLVRIIVTPNDPLMSTYPGLIFTVGSSAVREGRMIKKFVPFNNEEGWHVPQIILDQIEAAQMQKFKQVKLPNGEKTMQAYLTKKFNITKLPPLTKEELEALAASQKARGDS